MISIYTILSLSVLSLLTSLTNIQPSFISLSLHIKYILLVPFIAIHSIKQKDKYFGIVIILFIGFAAMIPTLLTILSNPNSLLELANPSGSFNRNSGTFPNPNMLGAYLFVLILCATFISDKVDKKIHRIISIGLIFFFLLLLILTFSRRSWFITVLMLFSYLMIRKGKKFIPLILSAFILLIISQFIDITAIKLRILTIFDSSYGSNSIRSNLFEEIFTNLQTDPYVLISGFGPGKVGVVTQFIGHENFSQIDSYPLHLIGEYGIIGVVLYYWLNLSIIIVGLKNLSKSNTKLRVLEICIFAGLLIIGMVGLTPITFPLNLLQAIFGGFILSSNIKQTK